LWVSEQVQNNIVEVSQLPRLEQFARLAEESQDREPKLDGAAEYFPCFHAFPFPWRAAASLMAPRDAQASAD
jgi:hypothetical protein